MDGGECRRSSCGKTISQERICRDKAVRSFFIPAGSEPGRHEFHSLNLPVSR